MSTLLPASTATVTLPVLPIAFPSSFVASRAPASYSTTTSTTTMLIHRPCCHSPNNIPVVVDTGESFFEIHDGVLTHGDLSLSSPA